MSKRGKGVDKAHETDKIHIFYQRSAIYIYLDDEWNKETDDTFAIIITGITNN